MNTQPASVATAPFHSGHGYPRWSTPLSSNSSSAPIDLTAEDDDEDAQESNRKRQRVVMDEGIPPLQLTLG